MFKIEMKWVFRIVIIFTIVFVSHQSDLVSADVLLEPPTPPVVVPHDETGYVSFIGSDSEDGISVPGAARSARPEERAAVYLNAYATMFGLQDPGGELNMVRQSIDGDGFTMRYQQVYEGVPVMAGELIVNANARGLRSISGEVSPKLSLDVNPTISMDVAVQTALGAVAKAQGVDASSMKTTDPELWIYDEQLLLPSTRPVELVWRMEVSSVVGAPINEFVLINAHSGGVSLHFNQIDTLWLEMGQQDDDPPADPVPTVQPTEEPVVEATPEPTEERLEEVTPTVEPTSIPTEEVMEPVGDVVEGGVPIALEPDSIDPSIVKTYSMNNDGNRDHLPGVFLCDYSTPLCTSGSDSHADNAHTNAYMTLAYYNDHHNRNSIDNAGMDVISSVHFDSGYNNAFWNGEQMVYGDGQVFPLADDVVAHEITHGVTSYESNLFYYYQSGAINEAFSDLWGEFFDLNNPGLYDDPADRWLIGEAVGAVRSMKDPTLYGNPDKMTSSYYYLGNGDSSSNDNGGVHSNNGVNSKAVYLMVDGDTFNSYTITGIGMEKVGAIYYEVQANLLTAGADYKDLYYAVQQACNNLIGGSEGITSADCGEVQNALNAVEMNLDPVPGYSPDPDACPSGYTLDDVFYDGFEAANTNWEIYYDSSLGETWGRTQGVASEGVYAIYGPDYQGANVGGVNFVTYMQNASNIALPSGEVYLHFEHIFGFEDPNYDGGVIQYSLNGGSWNDLNYYLVDGQGYNGTISSDYGNLYRGQSAFVGDSHGYVSSKYDLSSFAGQNLRFRWVMSADQSYADVGWLLDEIRVYECLEHPYASFTHPVQDGTIMQPRDRIYVEPTATAGNVVSVVFYAQYNDGGGLNWHYIGEDVDGTDGWSIQWGNANLTDETIALQAQVNNSAGGTSWITISNVRFTNSIEFGNGYETRGGEKDVEVGTSVNTETASEEMCLLELSYNSLPPQDEIFIYFSWENMTFSD